MDDISLKRAGGGGVIRVADNVDSVAGMGNITINDFHVMAAIEEREEGMAAVVDGAALPSYMMGIMGIIDAISHGV